MSSKIGVLTAVFEKLRFTYFHWTEVVRFTKTQCKPFAPNDNQCAPDESAVASPEAFELTEPVRIDFSRLCPEASHLDTALHLNRKP